MIDMEQCLRQRIEEDYSINLADYDVVFDGNVWYEGIYAYRIEMTHKRSNRRIIFPQILITNISGTILNNVFGNLA
jgi:hypothetical protein